MRMLIRCILSLAVLFCVLVPRMSPAIHRGSSGECDYCHRIHGNNPFLLQGVDPGSTCLRCHAYYQTGPVITIPGPSGSLPVELTPAGDFAWLKIDFPSPVPLAGFPSVSSRSERHGHSIVAAQFGYFPDTTLMNAPGGSYPSSQLTCVSCHDPHNRSRRIDNAGTTVQSGAPIISSGSAGQIASSRAPVGVYRLLGDTGYQSPAGDLFLYPAPDALSLGDDLHVSYAQGMSEWCSNCHVRFFPGAYLSGLSGQMHPTGKPARLTPAIVNNYRARRDHDNVLSGHLPLAPVEEGSPDYDGQRMRAAAGGLITVIDTSSNVMCLTCHRAHAGPGKSALRWPYSFLSNSDKNLPGFNPGSGTRYSLPDGSRAESAALRGMLCNKCHARDY